MYYTNEHEWIDYLGYTALVGICKAKLSGAKEIQNAIFCDLMANVGKGDLIATFRSAQCSFEVYMPVDGRVISFNPKLLNNPSLILSNDQRSMWVAKISPNAPYKRDGLLQEYQYKLLPSKIHTTVYG